MRYFILPTRSATCEKSQGENRAAVVPLKTARNSGRAESSIPPAPWWVGSEAERNSSASVFFFTGHLIPVGYEYIASHGVPDAA
jgi:hypothetical protein